MPEHVGAEVIPPGLKKRWEEFGRQVRACWSYVHQRYPDAPAVEAFEHYWECMRSQGVHLMSIEEARRYGVAPHPIAVIAGIQKGMSRDEAEEQAIREGKFHGISLMRAEIEMAKERGEL